MEPLQYTLTDDRDRRRVVTARVPFPLPIPGIKELPPLAWTVLSHRLWIHMGVVRTPGPPGLFLITATDAAMEHGLMVESTIRWTGEDEPLEIVTRVFNLMDTYTRLPKGIAVSQMVAL